MRKKRRAYTGREYYGFFRLGPEDAKFLEAAHQNAVTKELHCVPVQSRLERLERSLGEVGTSCGGTRTVKDVPFASQGRARRLRGPPE